MGGLEARKGPWSIIFDAVYFDFGNARSNVTALSGPIGPVPLPASANLSGDFRGFVGALEGGYSLIRTPEANFDLVGGLRYLRVKAGLDFQFNGAPPGVPPAGSVERTKDVWDGVIGVRGRADFAEKWFVSYYADVGAGFLEHDVAALRRRRLPLHQVVRRAARVSLSRVPVPARQPGVGPGAQRAAARGGFKF